MAIKKLNVYIIHAEHLLERRKVIDDIKKNLAKYSFSRMKVQDIVTITSHDPATLSAEQIQSMVNYTPIQTEDENLKVYNGLLRVLHVNNLSNALKHFEALSQISKCTDPDVVHLVIEDDVMFEPRMCMLLDKTIDKINDTQIVFLGMPNNEAITNSNNIQLKDSRAIFKILPYNDSYIVTPKLAADLASKYLPIKFHTNIHLSYLLETMAVPLYQTVPNLFVDGSKFGMYLSSQMVNNDLVFNREYMFLKSLVSKAPEQVTNDEKVLAEKVIKESQVSDNPDFLSVVGKYTREVKKDYKKTLDIYQKAFDIYEKNGAIINNESVFLRDFISLHAHLQADA